MKEILRIALVALTLPLLSYGQRTAALRINQVGYHPNSPKQALLEADQPVTFEISSLDKTITYYEGKSSPSTEWAEAGQNVVQLDFSRLQRPGTYLIRVPKLGWTDTFEIDKQATVPLLTDALRFYYYQRSSQKINRLSGGKWTRAAGHPDTAVVVHASAASQYRPAGTVIAAPRGWYDAGDYNKYVVNSGITTYTLLLAYAQNQSLFDTLSTGVPESANRRSDLLDEIKWNLDWLLTMQDPHDGGVYHKLTSPKFEGPVMPAQDTQARYVVQKSTAATLNFAAVMAVASRVYEPIADTWAARCRQAAESAFRWALDHPEKHYQQDVLNRAFDPDINTGAYPDTQLADEWSWAATELYWATRKEAYAAWIRLEELKNEVPNWRAVDFLPVYTILSDTARSPGPADLVAAARTKLLNKADVLVDFASNNAGRIPVGHWPNDFGWGSNAKAANMGMLLMNAFYVSGNPSYRQVAQDCLDYLLGRNALSQCFVTGHGGQSPQDPHHRISKNDGIDPPLPGMLVGGPQTLTIPQEDRCTPRQNTQPATNYLDQYCSFATNEVAINWNAPLVYLIASLYRSYSEQRLAGTLHPRHSEVADKTPSSEPLPIRLYPNPTNGAFTLAMPRTEKVQQVSILDLSGKLLYRVSGPEGHTLTLPITTPLPTGSYVVKVVGVNASYVERLVVE